MGTENATEPTLEGILSDGQESVSETEVENVTEEKPEEAKGKVEPEKPEKDFESRVQSEADKRTKTYQQRYETVTASLREAQARIKELLRTVNTREDDKIISAILSEDEENGVDAKETLSRKEALKQITAKYNEYKEKSTDIEETAQVMDEIKKGLSPAIVKEFGLDDPNPRIRAINGMNLMKEAVSTIQRNKAFQDVIEIVLTKGSEVRKQIDGYVSELMNLSDDARGLKLKEIKQGLKITPKDAPITPSGGGNTEVILSPRDKITQGLKKGR